MLTMLTSRFRVLGIRDFRLLLADRLIAPASFGFSMVGVSSGTAPPRPALEKAPAARVLRVLRVRPERGHGQCHAHDRQREQAAAAHRDA